MTGCTRGLRHAYRGCVGIQRSSLHLIIAGRLRLTINNGRNGRMPTQCENAARRFHDFHRNFRGAAIALMISDGAPLTKRSEGSAS